ncbi:MAG TPA: hypothetical protein VF321_00650 [Gaiellaceae bacterium]
MNSAIHYYTAAQRNADAIRDARRPPLPPRPVRYPGDPTPRRGLIAVLTRRLARPHTQRSVLFRP